MNIRALEEQWFASQPRLSESELLEIFPEALGAVKRRAKELCNEWKQLKEKIEERLTEIKQLKSDWFTRWFRAEVVNVWLVIRSREVSKEMRKLVRLFRLLNKPNEKEPNRIEQWQIDLAKSRKFEDFLEVNKSGFAKCPFHNEQHPSFYTRGGFGYCFSCGKHLDIISFVQETQNCDFKRAVELLT